MNMSDNTHRIKQRDSPTVRISLLQICWLSFFARHQYVPLSSAVTFLIVTVIFVLSLSFMEIFLFLSGSLVVTRVWHIDGSSPLQIDFEGEAFSLHLHQYVKFWPAAGDLVKLVISVENRRKQVLTCSI